MLSKPDLALRVGHAMITTVGWSVATGIRAIKSAENGRDMIDKDLYRQAYAEMQRWSEFAEKERLQSAAQLTPEERWRQFQILVAFSRNIQPVPSARDRAEKLAAVDRYYEAVRCLQEWRQQHGRSS